MSPTVGVYPAADSLNAGEEVSSTYEGRHITLTEEELKHPTETDGFVTKGDPVIICLAGVETSFGIAVGVAFNSGTSISDLIAVDTEGIWIQNVVATDDDGDSDVVPGDQLFISTAVPGCIISKITNTVTNIPFGYALGRVTGGSDGDIAVKVHFDPPDDWVVNGEKLFFGDARDTWLIPTGDEGYGGILCYTEWTVAGQTGRPFESQMLNNVLLGNYANALKGYMDCDESGGSTGLLSGVNGEIRLPNGNGRGAYFGLESEVVFQTSSTITPDGSAAGFLYLGASGAGIADFQDDGVFMSVVGLTNEAGHLLSLDYHTLRCDFVVAGAHLAKYLVFSLAENYISHTFSVIAADGRIFRLGGQWATPANPDGEGIVNISASITGLTTGEANLCSAWLNLETNAEIAGWSHLHTDGFYDATPVLTNAHFAWAKYSANFRTAPLEHFIMDLNMDGVNSEIDAIYNVNNPTTALGYEAGAPSDTEVGTIPFFSTGGTKKYIYLYPVSA